MMQHFIPQLILRNFVDSSGMLECFDRVRVRFFRCNPRNVFGQRHLYSYYRPQGRDSGFESRLSSMEGDVASTIGIVLSSGHRGYVQLTSEQVRKLKFFISLQIRRNPHWSSEFGNFIDAGYVEKTIDELESEQKISVPLWVRQKFKSEGMLQQLKKNSQIDSLALDVDLYNDILEKKTLVFGFAEKKT